MGVDPNRHGVVQIAIISPEGVEMDLRCKPYPGKMVSPKALEVTGLTEDEIRGYPDPQEVKKELEAFLEQGIGRYKKDDKGVFVAYNAKFDFDFLYRWWKDDGDKYGMGTWFWVPPWDVMTQAFMSLVDVRPRMKNFKLETVCRECGLGWDEERAHDAMYDVRKTRELFLHLRGDRAIGHVPIPTEPPGEVIGDDGLRRDPPPSPSDIDNVPF